MTTNTENKITRAFKLYDETIWLVGFGLLFLTYKALISDKPLEQKLFNSLGLLFVWIFVLLKVWVIQIKDARTVVFRGLLRENKIDPKDINEYQEWVRGARVMHKGGSILLWPYVEKQGELKSILSTMNPEIKFRDLAEEGTKTTVRVAIIVLAMFAYFGWLIWSLFHGITKLHN
jgi:hypothetical protein